ncbi:PfkB family carbohydrate kinase [Rouxiella sp. WC2420]|uniref:Ribokinase n=1 Tax=Rouxiella sp. WC2420 TaxID=3234145 RepID=A0AB39VZ93_9GAMM
MQVFVVGNISVDETYLINELPDKGASIHGIKTHQDLGGKGANQAIILSRCAIKTTLIAAIGNDSHGHWCKEIINHEPLTLLPKKPGDCRTDTSLILNCADGDNANITTTTAANYLHLDDIQQAFLLSAPEDVVLQQGNFSFEKTAAVFTLAREKKLTTVFNPSPVKPAFTQLLPLVDVLVVNQLEAQLLGAAEDIPLAAANLLNAGVKQVIVTLGAQGSMLLDAQGMHQVPAESVTVTDTTGAGDTFLAVMLACAIQRESHITPDDLRRAARASAITISRTGTLSAFPTQSELAEILR